MKTILLTDVPEIPPDERCPRCSAGTDARVVSQTFGPLHDVCGRCGYEFRELTVPITVADEEEVEG